MQTFRLISSGGCYSLTALSWTASRSSPSQFQLDLREHRIAIDMYASRRARWCSSLHSRSRKIQQKISKFQDLLPRAVRNTETTLRLERAAGSQPEASMMLGRRQYGSCS